MVPHWYLVVALVVRRREFCIFLVRHLDSTPLFHVFLFLVSLASICFESIDFFLWLHWVFVAARGFSSSCGERGLLFVVVHRLLSLVASLVAKYRL